MKIGTIAGLIAALGCHRLTRWKKPHTRWILSAALRGTIYSINAPRTLRKKGA